MATCGFATQSGHSCTVRRGGHRGQNNKWRNRGPLDTTLARVVILLATLPFLAGSTLGKGSSGITASKLGKSATRLARLLPFKGLEESVTQAVALAELEQTRCLGVIEWQTQESHGIGLDHIRVYFLLKAWCKLSEIEDLNVMHKFDRRLERLAMVMPLTDHFDPGVTHFAHEHLQEGDKISVPASILSELIRKQAEIPWQFELKLVRRKAPGEYEPVDMPPPPREDLVGKTEMPMLSSVACSILDARSPETFIFVPDWMMKALRLKPRDIVLYRHKDLNKASKIVLQPHSSAFLKMSNHQAVMETELRHYSALSRGTAIAFRYRKTLYKFNVLECIDVDGKSQEAVCVQDSDVATDFQAALDTPEGRRQSESTKSPHSSTHLGDDVDNTWRIDKAAEEEGDDEEEEDEDEDGWGSDEF